jgi:hypothetical protein
MSFFFRIPYLTEKLVWIRMLWFGSQDCGARARDMRMRSPRFLEEGRRGELSNRLTPAEGGEWINIYKFRDGWWNGFTGHWSAVLICESLISFSFLLSSFLLFIEYYSWHSWVRRACGWQTQTRNNQFTVQRAAPPLLCCLLSDNFIIFHRQDQCCSFFSQPRLYASPYKTLVNVRYLLFCLLCCTTFDKLVQIRGVEWYMALWLKKNSISCAVYKQHKCRMFSSSLSFYLFPIFQIMYYYSISQSINFGQLLETFHYFIYLTCK